MLCAKIKLLGCITAIVASLGLQNLWAEPLSDDDGEPLPHGAVARLGTARFRHAHARFAVFSPDGRTLASLGCMDGNRYDVRLWETATGRQLRRLAPVCMPADPDYSHYSPMAFSPDGRLLAVGGVTDFNTANSREWVELWEVATGKKLRAIPFAGPDSVYCLAFSPDGKTLAVADHEKQIQLVEVASGKEQQRITLVPNWITKSVRFAPDGMLLAYGTRILTELKREQWEAAQLDVREAATGKVVVQVRNPEPRDIYCRFTFSSDGKTAVICNRNNLVSVWEPSTGKRLRQWQVDQSRVHHLALAPDNKTLAIISGSAIQLWNAVTGERLDRTDVGLGQVLGMVLSADGRRLATRSLDHHDRIQVWDPITRQQVSRYQHPGPIHCLALSADGSMLAAGSKGIVLWDTTTRKELRKLPGGVWSGSFNYVTRGALAFAPDGKTLAATHSLTVWDVVQGNKVVQIPDLYLSCVAGSPNGQLIAGGGRTLKGFDSYWVALWDATGRELHRFPLGGQDVTALAFSADGKTLAAGLKGWRETATLRAWDTTTGRELGPFVSINQHQSHGYNQPRTIHCLSLSPDGKTIAAIEDHHYGAATAAVHLWETATGTKRGQLRGHESAVTAVAWFPDGRRIATASLDRSVLIWDLRFERKANLTAQELDALWADLAADAPRAFEAINQLSAAPADSLPWLQKRLAPITPLDPRRLRELLAALDDNQFTVRQQATEELEKLGDLAAPTLTKILDSKPPLETRQRVERLLARSTRPAGEDLRTWRAMEVLEHIGTPAARQMLEKMAQGAAGHRITLAADAALGRLSSRLPR